MDEATLLEKLRQFEALHPGATNEGERAAERIRARLAQRSPLEKGVG